MSKHELISLILKLIQEGPQTADTLYEHLERKVVRKKVVENKERYRRATQRRIRTAIDAIVAMGYERESFETTGPSNRKTWHIQEPREEQNTRRLVQGILPQVFAVRRQEIVNRLIKRTTNESDPIIESTHFYETVAYNRLDDRLKMVVLAIDSGQKLRITGMTGDSTSVGSLVQFPLLILPIKIIYHRGCFYIATVADQTQRVLAFQVDQLNMEAVDEFFNRLDFIDQVEKELRKRFGISQNIDERIYTVELSFSKGTGAFINKQFWSEELTCQEIDNGWLVTIQCGINRELVGWLYQWMSNVRVIGPPQLKTLYDEQLQRMLTITNEQPNAPLPFSNAFLPNHDD